MHNEEFHTLYPSQNIIKIKEDEMGGLYSTHGRELKCIQNFGRRVSRERTTLVCQCEDNIKIVMKQVDFGCRQE
jgi:hypothetical protein